MTPIRPLDVDADLTVTVGTGTATVRGHGDLVVVDAPSLGTAWRLVRVASPLVDVLAAVDVTVDFRVRGTSVATAGPGVGPGPLARALGLGPVRVHPGGLLFALRYTVGRTS